jgi:small subunit ribosomal protein S18
MEDTKLTDNGSAAKGGSGARAKNGTTARRPNRFQGPRPPRTCPFLRAKAKTIDYKNVELLRRYLTDHGRDHNPRRKVGTVRASSQRARAVAIKRARHIALLPFVSEATRGE